MYSMQISRHVQASRAAIYQALLDPEAFARWRVPDGMTCEVHEFDTRPGGRFRVSLSHDAPGAAGKSGGRTDTYQGLFAELVPDERVVEQIEFETADAAYRGTMTMTTTLEDAADPEDAGGAGTTVSVRYEGIPDGVPRADNEAGTRMALDNLARAVESR